MQEKRTLKLIFKQSKQSKSISIHLQDEILIINPKSFTDTGLWKSHEPIIRLTNESDNTVIYDLILVAFKYSEHQVKHPENPDESAKKFIKLLGYKSNSSFVKDNKLVSIVEENGIYEITIFRNNRTNFIGSEHKNIIIKNEKDLVPAIRKAFELCE
jgi:hypothetical protein